MAIKHYRGVILKDVSKNKPWKCYTTCPARPVELDSKLGYACDSNFIAKAGFTDYIPIKYHFTMKLQQSKEDLEEFLEAAENKNTKRKTDLTIRKLTTYLVEKPNEDREIYTIPEKDPFELTL